MNDMISRQEAIDLLKKWSDGYSYIEVETNSAIKAFEEMPSAQSEAYNEKLKKIADALSEKFAYMNTCLNERDIILGYLGVKRSNEIHCNTDCTNIKCESYRFDKRLSPAQYNCKKMNTVYGLDGTVYTQDKDKQGWNGHLPSAQSKGWMEKNKERILQAGKEGREIEFRIDGRLFAIREKAQ